MPLLPRSSYYDKDYRQSAALIRARKPYLIPNMIGGIALFSLAIGIYSYTINSIAQDDFSDVPIPDEPAQPAHTSNASTTKAVSPDEVPRRN